MSRGEPIPYPNPDTPISFEYPANWIVVTFPPLQPGGAFIDLHNGISAFEATPKEETGLVTYKPGDFSLRLLAYREGWQGNAYQTLRIETQRLYQYHYVVSEPGILRIGDHDAAQVIFGARVRDGAFIVFGLDGVRWVLASLSAAVGELDLFLPVAHGIIASVGLNRRDLTQACPYCLTAYLKLATLYINVDISGLM